jgi:hypothetical protein
LHTACVRLRPSGHRQIELWSEKLPFAGYSVVKDHPGEISPRGICRRPRGLSPGPPFQLAHAQGPKAPLRLLARRTLASTYSPRPVVRRNFSSYRRHSRVCKGKRQVGVPAGLLAALIRLVARVSGETGPAGPPPSANAGGACQSNLVENTGLEPVTSWLQTRRSPS